MKQTQINNYDFQLAKTILMEVLSERGGDLFAQKINHAFEKKYLELKNKDEWRITADEIIFYLFPHPEELTDPDEIAQYQILTAVAYLQQGELFDSPIIN